MAFVLGAVLASADPVAVTALGRRLPSTRVQALVQAESLFNDATSLVLFQIAVSFAAAGLADRRRLLLGRRRAGSRCWRRGGPSIEAVDGRRCIAHPPPHDRPVLEPVVALVTRMRPTCSAKGFTYPG